MTSSLNECGGVSEWARRRRAALPGTDTENSQGYNRYSYAYNNPLKYTDPSGNFEIVTTFLSMYATLNMAINTMNAIKSGGIKAGLANLGVSSVSSAISYGVGYGIDLGLSGASPGSIGALLLNAASGVLSGGLTSAVFGSKYTGEMALQSVGFSMISWAGQGIESYIDLNAEAGASGSPPTAEEEANAQEWNKKYADQAQAYFDARRKEEFGDCDKIITAPSGSITKTLSYTTIIPEGYGLNKEGVIITDKGVRVNGFMARGRKWAGKEHREVGRIMTITVSPSTIYGSRGMFLSVVGHEMIHAYHYSILGDKYNRSFSEARAYQYSTSTEMRFGEAGQAFGEMDYCKSVGFYATSSDGSCGVWIYNNSYTTIPASPWKAPYIWGTLPHPH